LEECFLNQDRREKEGRFLEVRLFLDSSVLLSAAGSEKSLSRLIVTLADSWHWELVTAAYCRDETIRNIGKFPRNAASSWEALQKVLCIVPNALTSQRPLLLVASKDKPVLISALAAKAEVLLTLDSGDFGVLLDTKVYGMLVATPRSFLLSQGLG
jgi:predicted nucleic acid-binding protein